MATASTPKPNDFALVLKEQGLHGINFMLFKDEVPDNEAAINAALANPEGRVATYFLDASKIDTMIATLEDFKRKLKAYKAYTDMFSGCENNPTLLATVVEAQLSFQEELHGHERGKGTFPYKLGGRIELFVDGVRTHAEAAKKVFQEWEAQFGSPKMWGLQMESDCTIWTRDHTTATKFDIWLANKYIIPTIKSLQEVK